MTPPRPRRQVVPPPDDATLERACDIARRVRQAGGRALIVGGWVRDRLLGRPSKDIDLEVYGLPVPALRALLEQVGPVNPVGESFTVFKVAGLDVSLPRRESKVGRGHRAFEVTGDPHLTPLEAGRRRDFTINAIAWDPLTGDLEDSFGGLDDLDAGVLRHVDDASFGDDSLRVLRAVQFVARFELTLHPTTETLCRAIPLDDLPPERVWGEIEKLLLGARRPSRGLSLAERLGVLGQLFPECQALVGCEQEADWHPEGDVWTHTLMVVDEARAHADDLPYPRQVALMLGAVAHDFGKPATTAWLDGRIRSPGHEEAGVAPALAWLDRLHVHTIGGYDVRRQVVGLVAHHLKPGMWHKAPEGVGDGAFRRLARKVDLDLLARLARADCVGRQGEFDCSAMDWFLARAQRLGVEHRAPEPLLLGRHVLALGLPPGPAVGRVLTAVYERQLDGTVRTIDDAVALARALLAGDDGRSGGGA